MTRERDERMQDGAPKKAGAPAARSSLFIGSAEKVFQVLHAFDGPRRHLTLADATRISGLDRSSAQRAVYTLEALGYLQRVSGTKSYRLTSKVLQFSYNYICANELIDKAGPYLLDLSRSLGETCNLQELDGHEIVFVARFPGQHLVNIDIVIGSRLPAYFTASGTAIIAGLPVEDRQRILAETPLRRLTPATMIDPALLLERVNTASERGYAIVRDETVMGDIAVASAVCDEHGHPVAAINVSVPATRWSVERAEAELARHVQVAATSISRSRFSRS